MPKCDLSASSYCQYDDLDYDNICMYCKVPLSKKGRGLDAFCNLVERGIEWVRERLIRVESDDDT